MNRDNLYSSVSSFLHSKHIQFPQQWLHEQISLYFNNNPSACHSSSIFPVRDYILQRWLSSDLRDVKPKILQENVSKLKSTVLQNNYVLQMNCVRDVGHSSYSQLCQIRKVDEVNLNVTDEPKHKSSWEPKGGRMLMLELTDGNQDISAIEYTAIPDLKLNLFPGTKILIKGPVECRRGVLFLQSHNVSVLGGKLDELLIQNAPENILARAVNKAENPNPMYESMGDVPSFSRNPENSVKRPASSISPFIPSVKRPATDSKTITAAVEIGDSDDEFLAGVDIPDFGPQPETRQPENFGLLDEDDEFLSEVVLEDVEMSNPETQKMPFMYLASILEERDAGKINENFVVKAFISTITGKLGVVRGKWQLVAKINDGTAALDVTFTHEVLEKLIGFSPLQVKTAMTQAGSAGNHSILQSARNSLLCLNCLVHISWPAHCQAPTVIKLEDFTEDHFSQ